MQRRKAQHELIGLTVETKSGERLGKVADIEIDAATHSVSHYIVRSANPLKELVSDEQLCIAPTQVVAFTQHTMVVEDMDIRSQEKIQQASKRPSPLPTV